VSVYQRKHCECLDVMEDRRSVTKYSTVSVACCAGEEFCRLKVVYIPLTLMCGGSCKDL
jgi:hypothetical protein